MFPYRGKAPKIHSSAFIDPQARVLGDVIIGENSVVMFGAIIRGDDAPVKIGNNVVVLENCIIEAPKDEPVIIGDWSLISHGAIVHGATVGAKVLIGIGAIVLDKAIIEEESIVASGAVVPPGSKVNKRTLVGGIPAKPLREVKDEDLKRVLKEVKRVIDKSRYYRETLGVKT